MVLARIVDLAVTGFLCISITHHLTSHAQGITFYHDWLVGGRAISSRYAVALRLALLVISIVVYAMAFLPMRPLVDAIGLVVGGGVLRLVIWWITGEV